MKTIKLENGKEVKISEESYKALVEAVKEPEHSLGWTPKEEEDCYFIDDGEMDSAERCKIIGNVYKTREEAEKVVKKRKAKRRIDEYAKEDGLFFYDADWCDYKQYKWMITGWSYITNAPTYKCYSHLDISKGNLIFRTEEGLKKVLKNCKEDLEIYLKD